MKEKIIVFGLGRDFEKFHTALKEKYDIVGYTDHYRKASDDEVAQNFIMTKDIDSKEYDKIIVCTRVYYDTIKYQLIHFYRIPEYKIVKVTESGVSEENRAIQPIIESIEIYKELDKESCFPFSEKNMWLISDDYYAPAGFPNQHYFLQDIWGARKVMESKAQVHYDIGSRLDGFISHLLVFMKKINYIDIRPLPYEIPGLSFIQADATNLEGIADSSIESLSSFHAVEHFGLGRYGDPIDPNACFKAMKAFGRVLKPDGHLYFGVPIGPENKLIFNAHRIFHPMTVIEKMEGLKLVDFAYIKELAVHHVEVNRIEEEISCIPEYSCGLFEFSK